MTLSCRTTAWSVLISFCAMNAGAQAPEKENASGDPNTAALLDRIAQLEAKSTRDDARISALEAEQNEQWLTQERAEQIKGLVRDVLADADSRVSMLQGLNTGYDNGFII